MALAPVDSDGMTYQDIGDQGIAKMDFGMGSDPVSYTHLTLPTIYSV